MENLFVHLPKYQGQREVTKKKYDILFRYLPEDLSLRKEIVEEILAAYAREEIPVRKGAMRMMVQAIRYAVNGLSNHWTEEKLSEYKGDKSRFSLLRFCWEEGIYSLSALQEYHDLRAQKSPSLPLLQEEEVTVQEVLPNDVLGKVVRMGNEFLRELSTIVEDLQATIGENQDFARVNAGLCDDVKALQERIAHNEEVIEKLQRELRSLESMATLQEQVDLLLEEKKQLLRSHAWVKQELEILQEKSLESVAARTSIVRAMSEEINESLPDILGNIRVIYHRSFRVALYRIPQQLRDRVFQVLERLDENPFSDGETQKQSMAHPKFGDQYRTTLQENQYIGWCYNGNNITVLEIDSIKMYN